jgi:hypothetical protein
MFCVLYPFVTYLLTLPWISLAAFSDTSKSIQNELLYCMHVFIQVVFGRGGGGVKALNMFQFKLRPPLWSSGQSYWLQIQRSRFRFPALPDFLRSSGSGTGST